MQIIVNTNNIIISSDGTTPDRVIEKASIASITGVFLNMVNNPSVGLNNQIQENVEITLDSGEKIAFNMNKVSNQPTWIGSQSAMNVGINAMKT